MIYLNSSPHSVRVAADSLSGSTFERIYLTKPDFSLFLCNHLFLIPDFIP